METPSSMRKVLTSATSNKNTTCILLMPVGKSGGAERRSALLDITNDSPIIGLAVEALGTPVTAAPMSKNSAKVKKQTPGSGEALLRGQVKSLLQRIEEEGGGELLKPLDRNPAAARNQCLAGSPALRFLAPTPANTPLVGNLSDSALIDEEDQGAGIDMKQEVVDIDLVVSPLTRALLFDSPGKSDISPASIISSELTYEGSLKSPDEDSSSVWSIQANASTNEDKPDMVGEMSDDGYEEEEDCDELDELCSGINRTCVEEFGGRHTSFMYNSDGEIEGEEEEVVASVSPSVPRLKGLPTPKGKHLRFPQDEI